MTFNVHVENLKIWFRKRGDPDNLIKEQVEKALIFLFFYFLFFLHTLFQFGLIIAPIQDTGLINAKYNNTLYGTIIIWYNK